MRIIGLDIHRAFAEAVAWDDGKLTRLGRVDMRRPLLEAFAKKLSKDDVVVVEATGNAASVAAVIAPHVKKVVIANSKAGAHHRSCEDQDRYDRRQRPRPALCERLSARGLDSRRANAGASPAGDQAQPDRPAAIALEEYHPVDPAQPSDPLLPARRSVRGERADMAFSPGLAGGRTACRRTASARVRPARRGPQGHRA